MRALRFVVGVAVVVTGAVSQMAAGQRVDDGRAAVRWRPSADTAWVGGARQPLAMRISTAARPYAPVLSAILPGGGQLVLGDDRFVAYAAVEVLSWWRYVKANQDQRAQEALFKDLALRVARAPFSAIGAVGPWSYYEAMRDNIESGSYSLSTTGQVVPETDATTFNGRAWVVALNTNPDSASALAQYQRLAVKPEFRWSWRNAQLQYDIFKRTTFKRDNAYQAGVNDLIVIGANHVLSMIDAFATLRLSVHADPTGKTSVGARLPW